MCQMALSKVVIALHGALCKIAMHLGTVFSELQRRLFMGSDLALLSHLCCVLVPRLAFCLTGQACTVGMMENLM